MSANASEGIGRMDISLYGWKYTFTIVEEGKDVSPGPVMLQCPFEKKKIYRIMPGVLIQ